MDGGEFTPSRERTYLASNILIPEKEPSAKIFLLHIFVVRNDELPYASQDDILDNFRR
jgi:hypothetical protein